VTKAQSATIQNAATKQKAPDDARGFGFRQKFRYRRGALMLLTGTRRYIRTVPKRDLATGRAMEAKMTARKRRLQSRPVSARSVVIYGNESGQFWCVYERARYVREPQLRVAWLLRARQLRDGARPDGDDARRRGGERRLSGDAH
jgi:hypothetical protein